MSELAKLIEHTILKPDTSLDDVRHVCDEAQQYGFGGICIPPFFVRDARRMLDERARIRLITVVAFPMGYTAIASKSEEIKRAIEEGADEIDAVINLAALKSGNWNHVIHDIEGMALATHMRGKTLKLILECGLLTGEEISRVCEIASQARISWVKTGTGLHGNPATVEMIHSLRTLAPAHMKIKASGGIRTFQDAQALIDAGADTLGTSASVEIVTKSQSPQI